MVMQRRFATLALGSAALLALTGCGGDTTDDVAEDSDDQVETEVPADEADEADTDAPGDEPWPQPLTIYIPAPAGGGFDIAVRALQPHLAEVLGNDVVPVNLEGAGGAIAADEMIRNQDPGASMMITSRTIISVPYTGTPELDPLVHLAPIGVTHQDVSAVTVRADAPYDTIEEFLDYARDNPGEIQIGTSGIGGVWHAAGLHLSRAADVEFDFIPYGGGADAGNALVAGEIDAVTIGAPETRPFIETGDVKMLAVMGEERSSLYPDVPTLQEVGIDVVYAVWRGYVVAADTPEDIRAELEQRVQEAVLTDGYQTAMDEAGFELGWQDADVFRQYMEEEDELIRELFSDEDFMTTMPERLGG